MLILMTEYELTIFASMLQVLPELLKAHPYGIFELAREFSKQLGEPINEVMTPLSEALQLLAENGTLTYDRPHNWVLPAS